MMEYKYEIIDIEKDDVLKEVYKMKQENCRIIQISCTAVNGRYEINYSFGKNYDFVNLRIYCNVDDEILSISSIYEPAFLYENELKDLFGINIKYMSLDYEGHLYKLAVNTPYAIKKDVEGEMQDE